MARDLGFGFSLGNGGSPASSSNIRVSVDFFEKTIFGGDELRCRINFINAAPKPQPPQPQHQQQSHSSQHLHPSSSGSSSVPASSTSSRHPSNSYHPERQRLPSSGTLAPPAPMGRGHHRASHSISGPATGVVTSSSSTSASAAAAASRRRADSISWAPNGNAGSSNGNGSNGNGSNNNGNNGSGNGGSSSGHSQGHSHRRSLSIVSLSSAGASDGQSGSPTGSPQLPSGSQHRPVRGHSRASSLQIGPRGTSYYGGPRSATNPPRPYSNQPSPLFNSSFPPSDRSGNITGLRGRLTGSATMPNTPSVGSMSRSPRSPSDGFSDFKFPMAPPPLTPSNPQGPVDGPILASPTPMTPEDKPLPALPIRSRDAPNNNNGAGAAQPAQVPTIYEGPVTPSEARVLSTTSIAGTPRSSGEFYSLSNHSTETLASEYMSQQPAHPGTHRSQQNRPPHTRQKSSSNLLSPPMHGSQQSSQHQGHHLSRSLSQRARTSAASAAAATAPETIMMGYAQIEGSFTLDGSLVDLSPFEQVKRKGIVGGQGGGVVGLKNNKRDSGLLRGFGWGSLTTSISNLLGDPELSTIKEMRDKASSKSVPLLTTPQSVLFADLQLAPGETKSYEYVFQLPKGLPPTHRGKVMKISYSVVIGTQKPGTAKEQRVNSIEFPFRVLGSVNGHGEILGHNLMSPYSPENSPNTATVRALTDKEAKRKWADLLPGGQKQQQLPPQQLATRRRRSSTAATITGPTMNGFMMYVDELLKQREAETQAAASAASATSADGSVNGFFGAVSAGGDGNSHGNPRSGLLSPTAILPGSRRMSTASSIFLPDDNGRPLLSLSCREAIELAIMRSNLTGGNNMYGGGGHDGRNISLNRFEISRNNMKVATIMLTRPAYRLGETITMVVDFSDAKLRCHAVHADLETIEKIVDPKLALRSEASVQRASRKVYASLSEATLYSRRFVFTATIPSTATPEFETTGIVLEWKIRVEFVVPAEDESHLVFNHHEDGSENDSERGHDRDHDDDEDYDDDSASRHRPSYPHNRQLGQSPTRPPPLMLEEITRDDRGGLVLAAVEGLRCESFEAAVPIRVYGWSGEFGGSGNEDSREKVV